MLSDKGASIHSEKIQVKYMHLFGTNNLNNGLLDNPQYNSRK
jgi:hypothetical protein